MVLSYLNIYDHFETILSSEMTIMDTQVINYKLALSSVLTLFVEMSLCIMQPLSYGVLE